MSAQYRAVIIGHTGQGDYGHGLDIVYDDVPEVEVVAVADPDAEGLATARERIGAANAYADYREMLEREEFDLVNVCPRVVTPHAAMVIAAAEAGAVILPASPAVYQEPQSFEDLADFIAGRILNLFGIPHELFPTWRGE